MSVRGGSPRIIPSRKRHCSSRVLAASNMRFAEEVIASQCLLDIRDRPFARQRPHVAPGRLRSGHVEPRDLHARYMIA